jgi:hypothetical protein
MGEDLKRGDYLSQIKNGKKLVVLSEFGLELADQLSLYRKLQPFIESHSWRLPLIFTGLYLRERRGESGGDTSDKKVSRFFARATLEIIGKIYGLPEDGGNRGQQELTKRNMEELLVALAFQVLAFDSEALQRIIRELLDQLSKAIAKEKRKRFVDGLTLNRYVDVLGKEIGGNKDLTSLRTFYQDLVQRANFGRTPLATSHLKLSCDYLIEKMGHVLENRGSLLFYVDKLGYVSKYAESRDLFTSNYRWALGNGKGISNLDLFWTTGLVGIFLLRDVLATISLEHEPPQENPLIQIGSFFQKDIDTWANLLVGDIGCTFGLSPFSILDDRKREKGIKLQSAEGQWISPYLAECFYDEENERINYRIPEVKEITEKEHIE